MFEDVPVSVINTMLESLKYSRQTLTYIAEKHDVHERLNNIQFVIDELLAEKERRSEKECESENCF